AQVCRVRRVSVCQAEVVGAWALSVWNSALAEPFADVLSGAKLTVRCYESGHGTPKVAGNSRVSGCSAKSGRVSFCGFIVGRTSRLEPAVSWPTPRPPHLRGRPGY